MRVLRTFDDWGHGRRGMRGDWHPFLGLLAVGLLITAVVLLVLFLTRRRPMPPAYPGAHAGPGAVPPVPPMSPTANAEAILAERLARSEISPDDYRAMIAALRESAAPPPAPPA